MPILDPSSLAGCHDIRLSKWGPYTKRYMGVSHIPDLQAGIRFDLSVFPELYRTDVKVPNVKRQSGYHPWEAIPDLSYYSHRHELIWKDQLYCDISFGRLDAQAILIRYAYVNQTGAPQNLALHYLASLHLPPVRTYSDEILRMAQVDLPPGAIWVDATQYTHNDYGHDDPKVNLTEDGHRRGEIIDHGFVDGQGLGQGFGVGAGDSVSYTINLPHSVEDGVLILRYRLEDGQTIQLDLTGDPKQRLALKGNGKFALHQVRLGRLPGGEIKLILSSLGGQALELDGLVLAPHDLVQKISFSEKSLNLEPELLAGPKESSLLLKYDQVEMSYGIAWGDTPFKIRSFLGDNLDEMMSAAVNQHPQEQFTGTGLGHYTNVFLQPIFMPADSEQVFFGMVCCGSNEEVTGRIAGFQAHDPRWETIHHKARGKRCMPFVNSSGKPYQFSQERMAATLLTNVVYPVRTRGTWIRHYTPGRLWDCLYTWDSGFIGLGLCEIDENRAFDCLNAYLTEDHEDDAAFIHHGSPVPVQHYLFQELWNRTQSEQLLAYGYPRLRRYHRFLAGRLGSSTTRMPSNLLRTWDYFYNSGGWDDYPAQKYVHTNDLTATIAPCINTAHAIRTAKILRMAALASGENTDEFDQDIALLSSALQTYAWDEHSGYFGYVRHDSEGNPIGILKDADGANFNMGLDGVSPLVAGICTPDQEERLLTHLKSDQHLWTPTGISTVDQSAPYFRNDGYWNGAVWMAHQWFIWKALLDIGETDFAHRIATTALDLWQNEVEQNHNCFEHFMIATGRGAGWHQFGGLSAPVLNWFHAYHSPGRLSSGLDVWVEELDFQDNNTQLQAKLSLFSQPHHSPAIIAVMDENHQYAATWNDEPASVFERYPGTLEIHLPNPGLYCGQLQINAESEIS